MSREENTVPSAADLRDSAQSHRATLEEVARLAKVSVPTASKALNGKPDVSEKTRARIKAIAEEIGFTPNSQAKSLITGRTGTVGLITHDLEGRFSIPLLMGAEDAFGVDRVSVLLCDARGDTIREQYHVSILRERRVDGLIVVGARPDPRPPLLGNPGVPVIYAYAPSTDPRDCSVVPDHVISGRLAVDHLLAVGRTKIAIIGGDRTYGASIERANGSLERLAEAGLEPVGGRPYFGSWSEQWGRDAARLLLSEYPDIDGLVCGNDQIARGCLDALHDLGKNVPKDVSVIGHDNWRILTQGANPELTSIDMGLEALGRRAAERLAQAMSGKHHEGIERIAPKLVLGGSTVP